MKTSNQILLGLLFLLLAFTIGIDLMLKNSYAMISLNDPYKNYEELPVHPFKYLKIKAGNAYAIEIKQSAKYDLKVMVSRKSFLNVLQHGDTLLIGFSVMSSPANRDPETLPRGLIISGPAVAGITMEGSNSVIRDFKAGSLRVNLSGNAIAMLNNLHVRQLTVQGSQNASVNFHAENEVSLLELRLGGSASAFLQDISYGRFDPLLSGDSRLILNARCVQKLQK